MFPVKLAALVLIATFSNLAQGAPARRDEPATTACPAIPNDLSSFNDTALPDPFLFAGGRRVRTLNDFACRQREVKELFQKYELGTLPGKPERMTINFVNNTLNLTVTDNGNTISFTPTIKLPTTGTPPFPAIIALDGPSIPVPSNIAVVTISVDDLAAQIDANSRGVGKFYQLYGTNATASAMMAWAWGVNRLVDALELTPSTMINTKRLGVTGCSRNGKGALVVGAFEPRIALTIPQESGSGGTDCWRLSDSLFAGGLVTQTASEIVQENVWFANAFDVFAQTSTDFLPFDHHQLLGLVAPRGLFAIDNIGYDWLGAESSFGCLKSAQRIYKAVFAEEAIGYSQAAPHLHCSFPSTQQDQLTAFINKFLLDIPSNTSIADNAGNYTFDTPGVWDPWETPRLL